MPILLNLIYVSAVYLLKFGFNFFIYSPLFLAGGALGYFLFYLNYFLYPFLAEKTDELAIKSEEFFQKKDFILGIKFLALNEEKMKFQVLKTSLNFLILIILTFFVSSSSGSFLGTGVCYGLIFHFNSKIYHDFQKPALLNQWFEVIKTPVDLRYQKYFVFGALFLSLIVSL